MTEPLFDPGAYDPVASALAKSQSMEQVERNADDAWKADAKGTVRFLAQTRETFTTDDVWFVLDKLPSRTHERRAMGAIMRWAATAGLIHDTNAMVKSVRVDCHSRPIQVWRSLIYKEERT